MVIIITGGTSGIGKETANLLASKGNIVYSLSRHIKDDENNIHYIKCDVTKVEDVNNAINCIITKEKQIDCLINNAGIGISGALEYQSEEDINNILEVNLKGMIRLTQKVIPFLRETKGKIINIGSIAGELAIPFQTMYSVTKSGVSIFSEALYNELKPFKIKVTCVMPGDTKTSFTENRKKEDNNNLYNERISNSIKRMENDEKNGVLPIKVAKVICKCIYSKKPPIKVSVGFPYKLFMFLKRLLPNRLINYVLYNMYAK